MPNRSSESPAAGMVYLIGAGPGDPGLLTIRGRECLRRADAVVYDYLVHSALLAEAGPGAEIIDAGKRKGAKTFTQQAINELLIDRARSGRTVARLKGGDPFVFGRGGEESLALAEAGVPFEVVPGVSSVLAVPAYAGIPLTHRGIATTVVLTTGHEDETKGGSGIPWQDVALTSGTLVFVMGMTHLAEIVDRLSGHGRAPDTPVAVIRWGTYPTQRTVVGALATIVRETARADLQPPGLIVVGEVVRLRERLNWFERRPLFGRSVIVTRAEAQAGELAGLLRDAGADVIEAPAIRLAPPASWREADDAIARLGRYRWVILTSANAVTALFDRVFARGVDVRALGAARVCAIGTKTAEAMRRYGIVPDRVAEESTGEGVVAALAGETLSGVPILLPRAKVAREVIVEGLTERGAAVDAVTVYETRSVDRVPDRARDALRRSGTIVTFTSPSTVTGFLDALGAEASLVRDATVACLGPPTAEAATSRGLRVAIQPGQQRMDALVQAIVNHVKTG
ncbi:MAG TPA: uroporphyrinogen-III C-methyltransferase [Nitrospiria bacterium]|nr:uroporphyrinogen-III C-methyltransferase [Nitrospiria bacterium]